MRLLAYITFLRWMGQRGMNSRFFQHKEKSLFWIENSENASQTNVLVSQISTVEPIAFEFIKTAVFSKLRQWWTGRDVALIVHTHYHSFQQPTKVQNNHIIAYKLYYSWVYLINWQCTNKLLTSTTIFVLLYLCISFFKLTITLTLKLIWKLVRQNLKKMENKRKNCYRGLLHQRCCYRGLLCSAVRKLDYPRLAMSINVNPSKPDVNWRWLATSLCSQRRFSTSFTLRTQFLSFTSYFTRQTLFLVYY